MTVVSEGSASSAEAQTAVSTQTSLPDALASSLGVDSSAFAFTVSPTIIGPPMPPPGQPPLPSSPPVQVPGTPPPPRVPALGQPSPPSVLPLVADDNGALTFDRNVSDTASNATVIGVVIAGGAAVVVILIAILVVLRMHKRKLKPKPTTNMIEVDPKLTSTAVHATVHADLEAISASAEGACSSVGDDTSIRMEDEVELELKELREQREDASPSPTV